MISILSKLTFGGQGGILPPVLLQLLQKRFHIFWQWRFDRKFFLMNIFEM
jgi:hypothetical protein